MSDKKDAPVEKKTAARPRKADAVAFAPSETPSKAPSRAPAAGAKAKLRRKDLIERVVAQSGAKRSDVTTIVEATLSVLGEALSNGEQLALPPFGNARVKKSTTNDKGSAMTVSLRRGTATAKPPKPPKPPKPAKAAKVPKAAKGQKAAKTGKQTLAEPAEAD